MSTSIIDSRTMPWIESPPEPRTLSELPIGEAGWVESIACDGLLRRRLLDLGFVPGARIEAVLDNPAGDPRVYRVRNTQIAIRRSDAATIGIRTTPPPEVDAGGCGPGLTCGACPFHREHEMGIDDAAAAAAATKFEYIVALAGNPNTGKSTVFNALTGLRQHVGNWPGKTVARAEGRFDWRGRKFRLVDLPGTYSLLSQSADEEIARDFVLFGAPDCTIVVLDATCIERNLNLTFQILELTGRAVVCINLMDEARRKGIRVDLAELERDLGVPVVATSARSGEGLEALQEKVLGVATGSIVTSPPRVRYEADLESGIAELAAMIESAVPGLPNARWIAMRLIDGGDARLREELESGVLASLGGRIGATSLDSGAPDRREVRR